MSISFEIEAELRKDVGKGASRRLRRQDKVPAIVYGANQPATSLLLDHNKTHRALGQEAFYSHILTLKIGNDSEKVILKDVQRHPFKPRILHLDLLRIRADVELKMHVPLHFTGEDVAPGIKEGGIVSRLLSDIEIACLPAHLPEYVSIDISALHLDDTIHLSDIQLPEGVSIVALTQTTPNDLPVVSIHTPRAAIEEAHAAAAAATEATTATPAAAGTAEARKAASAKTDKK